MTIKGSLYMKILYAGVFVESRNVQFRAQFSTLGEFFRGSDINFDFLTPKQDTLA